MPSQVPDLHDRSDTPAVDSTAGVPVRPDPARERERGAALVEFALVLPILLVLLLGTIDFGKAINYWIDQTHLSAEGVRWAAVNKNPGSGGVSLQQYIKQQADTHELRSGGPGVAGSGAEVCVDFPNGGTPTVGDPVRVRISTTYHWMLGGLLSMLDPSSSFAGTTTLSASATMRLEALPTNYSASCFSAAV